MLHHVEIYVSNIAVSHAFWKNILARVGWEESGSWGEGVSLANGEEAYLTFVQVAQNHQLPKYHRCAVGLNHLAFKVQTRAQVDALRQFCLDSNIPILYDDKYPFANGGEDYYALFVEDPDRIKVEFVACD